MSVAYCEYCGAEIVRSPLAGRWKAKERSKATGDYVNCPAMFPYGGHQPARAMAMSD